jgi:hypothetical protein
MTNNIEISREKLAQAFKILETTFENKFSFYQSQTNNNVDFDNIKKEKEILEEKYAKLKTAQQEILTDVRNSISLIKELLNKENANS